MSEDGELAIPIPRRPVQATGKRKRVVLSIHEKQQVLQRLASGEQPVTLSKAFGISRQQVSDIKKNRERILSYCTDAKHLSTLRRKTMRVTSTYHPAVEQELYRWIIRERRLGREVTAEALGEKASTLFMQYSATNSSRIPSKTITNWVKHFKRAHRIKTFEKEELENLSEDFVSAMDMGASEVATSGGVSMGTTPPGSYFVNSTAINPMVAVTSGMATSTAMEVHPCTNATHSQQALVLVPTVSLQATVNTVHQLNAQLARFEQDMATKLDYLEERVAKLCYVALPP